MHIPSFIRDLDMTRLTLKQEMLMQEARAKDEPSVSIGPMQYATTNKTVGISFVHHVEAHRHEVAGRSGDDESNGFRNIVIKLVKYDNEAVNYIGTLQMPTKTNKCLNKKANKTLCYCAMYDVCRSCYVLDETKPIEFIPFNYDDAGNHVQASSRCTSVPFFRQFMTLPKLNMSKTLYLTYLPLIHL